MMRFARAGKCGCFGASGFTTAACACSLAEQRLQREIAKAGGAALQHRAAGERWRWLEVHVFIAGT